MGMGVSKITYQERVPKLSQIKAKFKEVTGLNLYLQADLNLIETLSNPYEILQYLNKDINKIKNHWSEQKKIEAAPMEEQMKLENSYCLSPEKDNFIGRVYFNHPLFYELDFSVEGDTIQFYWFLDQYYFRYSFLKTLLLLGGEREATTSKKSNKHLKKVFMDIKKWDSYKWYNRPRK